MKYLKTIAVVAGLTCAACSSRANVQLSFANDPTGEISFGGGGFSFSSGNDFVIGAGSTASGYVGSLAGTTYSIGTISTIAGVETAPVTGNGQLTIFDGITTFTGNVSWDSIYTLGTTGGLNAGGTLNLTGITYTGNNVDLDALRDIGTGSTTVGFTFNPALDLNALKGAALGSPLSTTFAGTISAAAAVPEPTTVVAGVLLLLPFGLSAMRILRKNKSSAALA